MTTYIIVHNTNPELNKQTAAYVLGRLIDKYGEDVHVYNDNLSVYINKNGSLCIDFVSGQDCETLSDLDVDLYYTDSADEKIINALRYGCDPELHDGTRIRDIDGIISVVNQYIHSMERIRKYFREGLCK